MTQEAVEEYTARAAEKLRLSHWNITVELVDRVDSEESFGNCQWFTEGHVCTIRVKKQQPVAMIRQTIRHELIHLRLQGFKTHSGEYSEMYEFGIDVIASVWK